MSNQNLPSIDAIDNYPHTQQKAVYAVADDINVDILTVIILGFTGFSILFLGASFFKSIIYASLIVVPLRLVLPFPAKPEGLALITGASSGIGAELAYIFARNGNDLILHGRNESELNAVKKNIETKYGRKASIIVKDLSVHGAAKQLYDEIKQSGQVVDILVNNAGLGHVGDIMVQSEDLAEKMITLNITSLILLSQLFGKDMVKRNKGWILNNSSVGGFLASPGQAIYHATKHAVREFSECLSIELRGTNVVNTQIMPGPTRTQWVTRAHLEKTFVFAVNTPDEPKDVAEAAYTALTRKKRMVHGSWSAGIMTVFIHLLPRSIHITLGRLMNTPTPDHKMAEPKKHQ